MTLLLILSILFFVIVYRYFGAFLNRRCGIDNERATPAHTLKDGVDYVPTRASVLFGHHFSSIAGAGPIVGPIIAGMYFGWGPTWLWILLGAAFIGGIHDFGSTFISVRSGGKSIAEAMRTIVGSRTGRLFAIFVLIALVYVIIVFLDLTATNFSQSPAVATASGWFVAVALAFGWVLIRNKLSFGISILIFIPLTFLGLVVGNLFPAPEISKELWAIVLITYCFIAAILPVQLLLQPRDFLSSTFLYLMLILGVLGVFFSNSEVHIPFYGGWQNDKIGTLMPFLFITVACGACSGFHSIVSSGTTSKQLSQEKDICRINYGAMLVEGVLAVFALGTLAVLTQAEREAAGNPVAIFASGAGQMMGSLGLPVEYARDFTLLAVSTFLLTTLDTCTRLSRFIIEEIFDKRNIYSRYLGTLAVLVFPALAVFQTIDGKPAWQAIWPLFGATNQLMAALALVTLVVYLKSKKIAYGFVLPGAIIMIIMPLLGLSIMSMKYGFTSLLGSMSAGLFVLGLFVTVMAARYVLKKT